MDAELRKAEQIHDATTQAAADSLADKLWREAYLIGSGAIGGAVKAAEKDPLDTATKAVTAIAVGAVVGTAAAAASPYIAGGAMLVAAAGTGNWLWSTFNTFDEKNRRRNATIESAVKSTWESADARRLHQNEMRMQESIGRESLDVGLSLLSGVGAGAAMKGVPSLAGKVSPEFAANFFKGSSLAGHMPERAQLKADVGPEAAGNWRAFNERPSPDVVKQSEKYSCVSACGEMLSNGRINQAMLIEKLGAPADARQLAAQLSSPGSKWEGQFILANEKALEALLQRGTFAVELRQPNSNYKPLDPGHVVVVDGKNAAGNIMMRDPAEGTKYEMSLRDFLHFWSGCAVYRSKK